jgi:hypothetical protein
MKRGSKGAVQLSVGTIVVIVLAMAMLILGMVLVRSIMCSGILLTEEITVNVENEIRDLFQSREYGVKCMGEGTHEVALADGGRRKIGCVVNVDTEADYRFSVDVESIKGPSSTTVNNWVLDSGWSGTVSPGTQTVPVVVLDVPNKVSDTSLKLIIVEENLDTGTTKTHTSYIDVHHVGVLTSAVC